MSLWKLLPLPRPFHILLSYTKHLDDQGLISLHLGFSFLAQLPSSSWTQLETSEFPLTPFPPHPPNLISHQVLLTPSFPRPHAWLLSLFSPQWTYFSFYFLLVGLWDEPWTFLLHVPLLVAWDIFTKSDKSYSHRKSSVPPKEFSLDPLVRHPCLHIRSQPVDQLHALSIYSHLPCTSDTLHSSRGLHASMVSCLLSSLPVGMPAFYFLTWTFQLIC